jgi:hypothetical protein
MDMPRINKHLLNSAPLFILKGPYKNDTLRCTNDKTGLQTLTDTKENSHDTG